MSPCEQYQELISRMVDGDLSAKEERELSAHIESCPSCAALYRAFSLLSGQVSGDLEDAPFDLQDNVMAEIHREEIRRKNRLPTMIRIVMSAAACIAVIVGVYLGVSLTRGAHLGVAAYRSAMDPDVKQESVVTEGAVPESAEAPAAAPSMVLGVMEEMDGAQESNGLRSGLAGDAKQRSAEDVSPGLGSENTVRENASGALTAAPAETASMPAPAPVAQDMADLGGGSFEEDSLPVCWEDAEPEEEAAAEAKEADEALEEWELEGYDLSLLRYLLQGKATKLDQEELADALYGRILLHKGRESWTVLLYRQDEVLYYLDPVEETIYQSGLTREEWQKILD